jgi:hypothetical protein
MHLADYFAVYDQETNTFQLLKLDKDDSGEVISIVPWSMPKAALTHPFTNRRWESISLENERSDIIPWFRGQEWYIMPTGHTHTHFHRIEIDGRMYTWWSLHHRLYWSNSRIYNDMLDGNDDNWNENPTIPIVEFAYKRVLPRKDITVYPNWSEVSYESFKECTSSCWIEYLEFMSKHVDPKDLRIQTPNLVVDSSETDTEERITRAPRQRAVTPYAEVQDTTEEDNHNPVSNLCAYLIIIMLFTSFVSLYAFILFSVFESRPE